METSELSANAEAVELAVQPKIADVVDRARSIVAEIGSQETRFVAVQFGQEILRREKDVKSEFADGVKAAKDVWEFWKGKLDKALNPLGEAKRILSAGISAYDVEQERQRRIAEEKRQAEIRRQKEEAARVDREAQEKRLREEEAARVAHAATAEAEGNKAAGVILETPQTVAPPTPVQEAEKPLAAVDYAVPSEPEKQAGSVSADLWKYQVYDLPAFVRHILDGKDSIYLLFTEKEQADFRTGELNKAIARLKKTDPFPGVKAWPERNTSFKI